jgi:hypothetical protein
MVFIRVKTVFTIGYHGKTGVNGQVIRQIPYFDYMYYHTCRLLVFPKFGVIGCSIS